MTYYVDHATEWEISFPDTNLSMEIIYICQLRSLRKTDTLVS